MRLPALLRRAWDLNPTLTILFVAMLVSSAAGLLGVLIDSRQVLGMPTWAKTTKFSISLVLYVPTILWMLAYLNRWPRLSRFVGTAIGGILMFEMALIIFQGTRARPMHFNVSTPFEATLWALMSVTIVILFVFNLIGFGLLLFQRIPDRVQAWGIRLGLAILLVGLAQGFLMTGPQSDQLAQLQAGGAPNLIGAHTVGAPDGGPGLPLLGWSTERGDLRIGHFVGLHALQAIPLLAFALSRRRESWLREGHRLALVVVGAAAYLGLVALVTWQALRGQPLLAPDAVTLGTLAGLVAATVVGAGGVLVWARR
jgi:hypothetical protein